MSALFDAIRTKFGRDLAINVGAFAVMGVAGIAMNVFIGRQFGAAALGVFNQLFAVHIFLSQFAVLGVQFSVLRHIPEHAQDKRQCGAILASGLLAASLPAFAVTLAAWSLQDALGALFDSDGVRDGLPWIVASVWIFAANKILLNALNGVREMAVFAAGQAGRFVAMFALLIVLAAAGTPANQLSAVIFGAELLLCAFLMARCAARFALNLESCAYRIKRHLEFGARGFLSGSMSELNSRVDVIILGIFASDGVVGVYSFAATVAEGLGQLPIVLRNNLNPLLTQAFASGDRDRLAQMAAGARRATYRVMAAIILAAILVFPFFVQLAVAESVFAEASLLFTILAVGLWLGSGYMPLDMYLVQCGFPDMQSFFKAAVLATNITLNLALIPVFGPAGAATAMAASWALSALYVRRLGWVATGVKI